MINTGPTNAKIYDRCIRLIARFSGCQYPKEAHDALLRYVANLLFFLVEGNRSFKLGKKKTNKKICCVVD